MSVQDTTGTTRAVTAGVDWAKDNHAVCVIDSDGEPLERVTVPHSKAGLARLNAILDRHGVDAIGIERGDGPVIDAFWLTKAPPARTSSPSGPDRPSTTRTSNGTATARCTSSRARHRSRRPPATTAG